MIHGCFRKFLTQIHFAFLEPLPCHSMCTVLTLMEYRLSNAHLLDCSIIFGRAIKNEYLTLGTVFSVGGIGWALKSGGKKEPTAQSSGQSLVDKVKEAVPINANSRCVAVPFL